MKSLVEDFLNKENVFAVVGASRDPGKYGHKVFGFLLESGFKVYPVNPRASKVMGRECFPFLTDLPEKPDVVDFVVPPRIVEKVVEEAASLGVKKVWMQPGSESGKVVEYCKKHGVSVVHGKCVMVEAFNRGLACGSCGKYFSCPAPL